MVAIIKQSDIIQSVADALQYISYYHPKDYILALAAAYEREESPAAKDAMAQILVNSRMCAEGKRPICQDTGIVIIYVEVGMDVRIEGDMDFEDMFNEGVRRAYLYPDNVLRASIVSPPLYGRSNTGDNTPAVIHTRLVKGNTMDIKLAAKGGGSENKSKFAMLNPGDSIVDWVLQTVPQMGAGWCPPGILGIGIGGSAEKAMLMAKESLMESIDLHELQQRSSLSAIEKLRLELVAKINALGIGAQGLGGLTTVLDVKIKQYPTHAASLPVAMIPNCAATRHIHFTLKSGGGGATLTPPRLEDWPAVTWEVGSDIIRRVDLDQLTRKEITTWRAGDRVLLSGKLLTGRDAAHARIQQQLMNGEGLPEGVDFTNRMIYYVGPVDPIEGEVVGPAGPTTATRMDKYTDMMLEETGLLGMIGKAERGSATIDAIARHQSVYLIAVGGAAYLVSQAIRSSRMVAFADLGMESIREFEVVDMPVTVAVDSSGNSVHQSGPQRWRRSVSVAFS